MQCNNIQEPAPEKQIKKTSSKDKKEETNIPSIFENSENKDNRNLSLFTSKEDKYKRL